MPGPSCYILCVLGGAALKVGLLLCGVLLATGCGRAPSPLYPALEGSIGLTHRGVLTSGMEIPAEGRGYSFLRDDDRHHATPRFAKALMRAAARVDEERPGAILVLGDLSKAAGGQLLPHLSHRSGRDADLLLYAMTEGGAPVASPGFIHYGPDGLAWDKAGKRYLRFDVARQWILIRSLLDDPEAHVQWIFLHRYVKARLVEWARASGEPGELIARAFDVIAEPHPGGAHDDHAHVRTTCTADEVFHGCEPFGPLRAWLAPKETTPDGPADDAALALELSRPLNTKSSSVASASAQ